MTREGDRLGCALWLQPGIYAEVLNRADEFRIEQGRESECGDNAR